jgi:hypothetical protein
MSIGSSYLLGSSSSDANSMRCMFISRISTISAPPFELIMRDSASHAHAHRHDIDSCIEATSCQHHRSILVASFDINRSIATVSQRHRRHHILVAVSSSSHQSSSSPAQHTARDSSSPTVTRTRVVTGVASPLTQHRHCICTSASSPVRRHSHIATHQSSLSARHTSTAPSPCAHH